MTTHSQPALFADVCGAILPAGSLGELGAAGVAQAREDAARLDGLTQGSPVEPIPPAEVERIRAELMEADEAPRRTYRERRLARAERLEGWAEGRKAKAETASDRAHELAAGIPMGQPILIGHHSQRRHERDAARIDSAMSATVEHSRKAERHADRADSIRAQAERAIYSDDHDAIERLRERIAEMEAERDRIKVYNASCRKGARDLSLLDEKQRRDLETTARVTPYMLGKKGEFPRYVLTNLGGNIARNRKRLAELERSA